MGFLWKKKSNRIGDNPKQHAKWEKKFAFLPTIIHKDCEGIETKICFDWYEERWYYEPSPIGALFGLVTVERRPLNSDQITTVDKWNPDPRLYF